MKGKSEKKEKSKKKNRRTYKVQKNVVFDGNEKDTFKVSFESD